MNRGAVRCVSHLVGGRERAPKATQPEHRTSPNKPPHAGGWHPATFVGGHSGGAGQAFGNFPNSSWSPPELVGAGRPAATDLQACWRVPDSLTRIGGAVRSRPLVYRAAVFTAGRGAVRETSVQAQQQRRHPRPAPKVCYTSRLTIACCLADQPHPTPSRPLGESPHR